MEKEQEAMRLIRLMHAVTRTPKSTWSRDVENGMSGGRISLACRIFDLQLIALASYRSYEVDLKRVFALLLVGEIDVAQDEDESLEERYEDIVYEIKATYWGKELVEEFRSGKTNDAKYALACMRSRNAWEPDHPRRQWGKPRDFYNDWGWGEECQKFFEAIDNTLSITECAGWLKYGVKPTNGSLETIAEHSVFSQLCAVVMNSVYSYGVDIEEVIFECAIHHFPDAALGAHTIFERHDDAVDTIYNLMQFIDSWKLVQDSYIRYEHGDDRLSKFAKSSTRLATDSMACFYDRKKELSRGRE